MLHELKDKNKNEVNVLLVEDDAVDVLLVKRGFADNKIANPIIEASDGIEALEKLRSGEVKAPYMILLDLNMPRMGGLEFLDNIRQDEELKHAIVFVMTTSKADEDKWNAYKRNIAGYIVKENVGEGFLNAIEMLDTYWRVVELV